MEEWTRIPEFPNYSVSSSGNIRNDRFDRLMTLSVNQRGAVHVALMQGTKQYRRSVALLVANTYLPEPPSPAFDTPIHLDGDPLNNAAENLLWRPFWFAMKYKLQFRGPRKGFRVPIEDVSSGEQFPTSWEAATKYGLLDFEILLATQNRTYVWPTYQRFRVL